jgi:class 3 adenylate cyclase
VALKDDLQSAVKKIFTDDRWTIRDGNVVPEPEKLGLGNDGVNLDGTVLYADISGSTQLVDSATPHFAAEVYKAYLACAARIIKNEEGVITAYDGDRVMAVFIGKAMCTNAVRAALKIKGAVGTIVQPAMKAQYPQTNYVLKHVIGVDTSKLLASRIGVRNDNDLVWVGRAANYAAKLTTLSDEFSIWITGSVYDGIQDGVKFAGITNMWTEHTWNTMNKMRIYRCGAWKIDV